MVLTNAAHHIFTLVTALAAVFAARWGLVGVIYGVGLGWLLRALGPLCLMLRHLQLPAPVPVTAP